MILFLNASVLLNGRRAMQESALLLFGLVAVWAAFHLAGCLSAGRRPGALSWMMFTAATGLALAAKHSGVIFTAGSFAVLIVASLRMGGIPALRGNVRALILSAAAGIMVFLLLSPALWNRPWERVADVVSVRAQLVGACSDPVGSALPQRMRRVLTMPFLEPTQYFELFSWQDTPGIAESIRFYESSGVQGLPRGGLVGWALTACVAAGVVFSMRSREGDTATDALHLGVLAWWVVSCLLLLANPLPVQRYYLPLVASSALLAALGVVGCLRLATSMLRSASASRRPDEIQS
jgi:hypothetical protein